MTPLTAVIIFGVLGLGAVYVFWPVLRPRFVRSRPTPGTSTHELAEPVGVWSVIELDPPPPPPDRSQWPKWTPTPKGRWES